MGNIKCVIAAGGLGTRLKDYRNSPTKMLLEVNGTPMINRQISQLQDWGLEDFIIITNPEFEALTKEVTNKEFTNLNLKYSVQENPEGISHAFLQAEEYLSEDDITVFILGDNFFEYNPLSPIKLDKSSFNSGCYIFTYDIDRSKLINTICMMYPFSILEKQKLIETIRIEDKIKVLAKWLNNVDSSTFYYDSERSGKLEYEIMQAQVEVCNKIGDMLEEILQMDEEQLKDNLEN